MIMNNYTNINDKTQTTDDSNHVNNNKKRHKNTENNTEEKDACARGWDGAPFRCGGIEQRVNRVR